MAKFFDKTVCLAVETSGRGGSIAVGIGGVIVAETAFSGLMRHSVELFTVVKKLLCEIEKKSADIGHIYISIGPGSFTGLRISASFAKMMALATDAKIVTVRTSDTLAENVCDYIQDRQNDARRIATIIDAKRREFFVATFERVGDKWVKVTGDCLMSSKSFVRKFAGEGESDDPIYLLGEGLVYYKDQFAGAGIEFLPEAYWAARASGLYKLAWIKASEGDFADAASFAPMYLRKPV